MLCADRQWSHWSVYAITTAMLALLTIQLAFAQGSAKAEVCLKRDRRSSQLLRQVRTRSSLR